MDLIAELASISQANHVLSTRIDELERDAKRWRECVRLESVAKSFGVTLPQALIVWGMDKAAFTDSIDASIAAQKKAVGDE